MPKRLPFTYENLGERRVKGFDEPVRVFAVSLQAGAAMPEAESLSRRGSAVPAVSDKLSIAVLPFVNMSGDPEQEHFSDGITEDIITELSRFKNLLVIARNSSFTFKGRSADVKEIGRRLHVNHIVEGSVRKAGNRVRVTAQLVEAASGNHLWAERYDRSLEDIFAVQDEVASSVVAKLGLNLREAAAAYARSRPTEVLNAYDHFLRGRAAWWRGNWNEGFVHLERALASDPGFAAAHAWLALQYAYQSFGSTTGFSSEKISEKTRAHAEAALALDDKDPFVHMAASMAFGFSPRPERSAACLAQLGRIEEARARMADMESSRPTSFDLSSFVNAQAAACARPEDAEHWREGFRKTGVPV